MSLVFLPKTMEDLWTLKSEHPEAVVYAGGTDLLVKRRLGLADSSTLICLERLDTLKGVEDLGEEVWIGAATTHSDLLGHSLIRIHFPILTQALQALGSPLIRQMGTLGGNVVSASPAGDTLPPLYVLGAEVELQTLSQKRRISITDFIQGPGQTVLSGGEILSGVYIRKQPEFTIHHFEKVGRRRALAIALVSLAAIMEIGSDGLIRKARLAWGSMGPTVVTYPAAEELLPGNPLCFEVLEKAASQIRAMVSPIDDVRASAEYRRQVAGNLLIRLMDHTLPDGRGLV
jgi:xanthine dehydrogenase FAD-binding subunit